MYWLAMRKLLRNLWRHFRSNVGQSSHYTVKLGGGKDNTGDRPMAGDDVDLHRREISP
jgi:hypothetical protein